MNSNFDTITLPTKIHIVKAMVFPVVLYECGPQGKLLPAAKSLQSCPTLCDPMDCSLPGFSIHGILQARTLEWVAISFCNLDHKFFVRQRFVSFILYLL